MATSDLSRSVLMIGTSLDTKGGIASVIKIYQTGGLFARWPITYLATHCDGGFSRKLRIAISAWLSYLNWIIRRRDFVLHVHSASRTSFWRKSAFIVPALWMRRPVIFHLHGGAFMHFYERESGILAKRVVRYILNRCTRIVVLTDIWRGSIRSITSNPAVVVIVNPARPVATFVQPELRRPGTLLFLGKIERLKGIYILLDALVIVHRQFRDIRLICGGHGEIEEVREGAFDRGLSGIVELPGWVNETRRTELLATSSIYVLPSFAEGLPMSILEAMSAGMPIISTPVGGIPEAISDSHEGFLVPVGDAEALSEAICRLLSDPGLCHAMGCRARETFDERFSVDVVLPRLDSLYRELGVTPAEPC